MAYKKTHIKSVCHSLKSRQQGAAGQQGDLSCALSKSDIIAGYIQLQVLARVAPDTGEKRAGDLYVLLRLWQRKLWKKTTEEELVIPASTASQFLLLHFCSAQRSTNFRYAPFGSYFHYTNLGCLCPLHCRVQISSISIHSQHIYLWHSPTL